MIWGIIILIIIAAALCIELYNHSKYVITLPINEQSGYALKFHDDSTSIIYSTSKSMSEKDLKEEFKKFLLKNEKGLDHMLHLNPYRTNNINSSRSVLHGFIRHIVDSIEWLKTSITSVEQDKSSAAETAVGMYVRIKWMFIKILFTYSDAKRNVISIALSSIYNTKNSIAENIKIIDYVKNITITTNERARIYKLL